MPGVLTTAVGYIGGSVENPTYEDVCSGRTGHTEAVLVVWDPSQIAFGDLMRNFLQSHDPTQGDGQGNDRGTQYRSGVYVSDPEYAKDATLACRVYEEQLKRPVTTEIVTPQPTFWYAEDYHQQYLANPKNRRYCSAEPSGVQLDSEKVGWSERSKPKLGEDFWAKYGPKKGCVLRDPDSQIVWGV